MSAILFAVSCLLLAWVGISLSAELEGVRSQIKILNEDQQALWKCKLSRSEYDDEIKHLVEMNAQAIITEGKLKAEIEALVQTCGKCGSTGCDCWLEGTGARG